MNAVDSNVLVYAYDQRDLAKKRIASTLIESLSDGILLWQVACEFVAVSRKLARSGFTIDQAWQRLDEVRALLTLVYPSDAVLDRARTMTTSSDVQFWDAMIYAACLEAGVTRIYSEDLPGQSIQGLNVVNPFS